MAQLQYARLDEQLDPGQGPFEVDPSPLVGTWINTNSATTGIARVTISRERGGLSIAIWPADVRRADPRYRVTADGVYSNGPGATAGTALSSRYCDESENTTFEANLSLGLLVVVTCHTFKSSDVRTDYFSREFFHYAGAPSN
jgi:hypothetical protein